jgi:hypothetical protein
VKLEWIGWVATAFFASSYFFKQPDALRKVQAGAAMLWVIYGLIIHAFPVVVANLVVASVALYSSYADGRRRTSLRLVRDKPEACPTGAIEEPTLHSESRAPQDRLQSWN